MEDQIAELKTEEDSSENGLLKDFGLLLINFLGNNKSNDLDI